MFVKREREKKQVGVAGEAYTEAYTILWPFCGFELFQHSWEQTSSQHIKKNPQQIRVC